MNHRLLLHLLRKEFLQISRNAFLPKLIVVFPIMMMCVMPWVMDMEVRGVRVDVVDNDRTPESQRLVHRIEQSPYFLFNGQPGTYSEAMDDIESGRATSSSSFPRTPRVMPRLAANRNCSLPPMR